MRPADQAALAAAGRALLEERLLAFAAPGGPGNDIRFRPAG
jgi:hypothetical protein